MFSGFSPKLLSGVHSYGSGKRKLRKLRPFRVGFPTDISTLTIRFSTLQTKTSLKIIDFVMRASDYKIIFLFCNRGNGRQLSSLVSELCSGRFSTLREPTNNLNTDYRFKIREPAQITHPNLLAGIYEVMRLHGLQNNSGGGLRFVINKFRWYLASQSSPAAPTLCLHSVFGQKLRASFCQR